MKHFEVLHRSYLPILVCLLLVSSPASIIAQTTNDRSDKELERQELERIREEMEARNERTRDSKASRTGYFRVWNFADPTTERLSVVLKTRNGENITINRSLRPGVSTAYHLLPAEEYEILLYQQLPVVKNEDGTLAEPSLDGKKPLLQEVLTLDLDPRTCQTLLIRGSAQQLNTKILQDFESDGQAVLRIINTLEQQPLSISYGRPPQLTSVVYRFDKGTTTKRLNLNQETDFHIFFQQDDGLSSHRITSLDYGLNSAHSLVFHLDRYARPTITSTRDGYRAALLDQ